MPRTIVINYAHITGTPQTTFSPVTMTGNVSCSYTVGHRDDIPSVTTDSDGNTITTTTPIYTEYGCLAVNGGNVSFEYGPTDTGPIILTKLRNMVAQQENLDLTAGDEVL